jgi:hypothetical protein
MPRNSGTPCQAHHITGARLAALALQRQQSRPVRPLAVVAAAGAGCAALVQQLQVARVHREGLVRVDADQVAVADVVGPGGARVGLAGERAVFCRGLRSPTQQRQLFTFLASGRYSALSGRTYHCPSNLSAT